MDVLKSLATCLVDKGIGGINELHYADMSYFDEVNLNDVEKKKLMTKFQGTSELCFPIF